MKITRPVSIAAAVVWTVLVIVALSLPGSRVPQTDVLQYDKALHALLFGVGVFLWLRIPWGSSRVRWVIVLAALALAPASELYQDNMGQGRAGDPKDALADVAGVALGAGAWLLVRRARHVPSEASSADDRAG